MNYKEYTQQKADKEKIPSTSSVRTFPDVQHPKHSISLFSTIILLTSFIQLPKSKFKPEKSNFGYQFAYIEIIF